MTREQLQGQVRELVNVAGGALAAFGIFSDNQVAAIGGLVMSVAMVFWGFRHKDGVEKLMSLIRKAAGAFGAMIVAFEWLEPERARALVAVLGPLFAVFSSHWHHAGRGPSGGHLPLLGFLFCLVIFLPSCTISIDAEGRPVFGLDAVEAARLVDELSNPPEVVEPQK